MGQTTDKVLSKAKLVQELVGVAAKALGTVLEHLDEQEGKPTERRGGFFYAAPELVPGDPENMLLHVRLGIVSGEKWLKYWALSREKAGRLAGRPGDISSHQTRDANARLGIEPTKEERWGMWGGAIRTKDFVFSFSGLSEHGDEAVMLLAALEMSQLTLEQAHAIMEASNNELVANILNEMFDE